MRRVVASSLLLCTLAACSSDDAPVVHGQNFADSGGDTSMPPGDSGPKADAGADAGDAAPVDAGQDGAPACAATTVILAGNGSSLFGGGGSSTVASATAVTGSATDRISIATLATGFVAVTKGASGSVSSAVYSSSWGAAADLASAKTVAAPAVATFGKNAEAVYLDATYKFQHRTFTAGAWTTTDDQVGGTMAPSFGPSAPALTGTSAELAFAQAGNDHNAYVQSDVAGTWQAAVKVSGMAGIQSMAPPAITTMSGGVDLLVVFADDSGGFKLTSAARIAGTWAPPVALGTTVYTSEPMSLVALPAGKALLAYRGGDMKPYFAIWDGTSWTAPAGFLSANPVIDTTPSLAPGVCGDDAVAALVVGGGVQIAHFSGGSFKGPDSVSGVVGALYAGIATRP